MATNSRNVCQFIRRHANKRHKKHPRQTGTKSSPNLKYQSQPPQPSQATTLADAANVSLPFLMQFSKSVASVGANQSARPRREALSRRGAFACQRRENWVNFYKKDKENSCVAGISTKMAEN